MSHKIIYIYGENVELKKQPCLTPTLDFKKSVMPSCDLIANNTSLDMFCIISKMDLLYYIGKVCKKNGNTM